MENKNKIILKVEKLMTLANDPSASQGEAENATKAANKLMMKYQLSSDDILLGYSEVSQDIVEAFPKKSEYQDWLWDLLSAISKGNMCTTHGLKNIGSDNVGVSIIEYVDDIENLANIEKKWIVLFKDYNPSLLNIKLSENIRQTYTVKDDELFQISLKNINNIGETIKRKRKHLGISQNELSSITKLSRSTISRIENQTNSKFNFKIDNVISIMNILNKINKD